MIIKKTLLAGFLGCTMLAGCNGDDNKNNDAAGTFAPTNNPDPVLAVKPTLPKEDGPAPAEYQDHAAQSWQSRTRSSPWISPFNRWL